MSGAPGETSAKARIDGLFELALRRHQAGELREAEQLYRSILDADPRQLDALHFLGEIAPFVEAARRTRRVSADKQFIAFAFTVAAPPNHPRPHIVATHPHEQRAHTA